MTNSYPSALTASGDQQAVSRAIAWCEQQRQSGEQVAVWAPGKQNLSADSVLAAYAQRNVLMTARLRSVPWSGGPVLAAWPPADDLARLAEHPRVTALCVLTWRDDDVAAWAASRAPMLLTPGAVGPPLAVALDPVVVQALRALTVLVNQANHLAGALDKRDAVAVLTVLHRGGYPLDPDAVYQWALANEWRPAGAQRLREMTSRFAGGRPLRLQSGAAWPLREDVLEQWRKAAEGE